MLVHRLVRARHAGTALDGEGARRVGGRWNPPGLALVYAASSLSLAVLELLVHVDPCDFPEDLLALRVEIPDDLALRHWLPTDLPRDWRRDSGLNALRARGAAWLRSGAQAAVAVPSVIVPSERNLLINPGHPDLARIRVLDREPFSLDPRLR
jgi:RES domain-containing protein